MKNINETQVAIIAMILSILGVGVNLIVHFTITDKNLSDNMERLDVIENKIEDIKLINLRTIENTKNINSLIDLKRTVDNISDKMDSNTRILSNFMEIDKDLAIILNQINNITDAIKKQNESLLRMSTRLIDVEKTDQSDRVLLEQLIDSTDELGRITRELEKKVAVLEQKITDNKERM